MVDPVFKYDLSPRELQKLGELTLTWSHTEQLIGYSLKMLLKLSNIEATEIVFKWNLEQRLQKLYSLDAKRINNDSLKLIAELQAIMPSIQVIRNNVIHAILVGAAGEPEFRLHSKNRNLKKEIIFGAEDITNYACRVAINLWWTTALQNHQADIFAGWKPKPLPERPELPKLDNQPSRYHHETNK